MEIPGHESLVLASLSSCTGRFYPALAWPAIVSWTGEARILGVDDGLSF